MSWQPSRRECFSGRTLETRHVVTTALNFRISEQGVELRVVAEVVPIEFGTEHRHGQADGRFEQMLHECDAFAQTAGASKDSR